MAGKPRNIMLVDGHSLIFRAFHALPLLDYGGVYTNAVQGFFSMLFKAVADYRPDALCVMLDTHAPTFRHKLYSEYKAGRKPTPEELKPQVPVIRDILQAMNVTVLSMEGYEADDLLGTAARRANKEGIRANILTGDRDALQLITDDTNVILTKKGISESLLLSPETMPKLYGYTPEQAIDLKALMGDSSDNIPGVPGVGEKTALKLLTEYGDLEGVYRHADEIKGKLGEKVRDNKDRAELSKALGTICVTAPLAIDFTDCGIDDMPNAIPMMQSYKLRRLSELLMQLFKNRKQPPAPAREAHLSGKKLEYEIAPMQPFMTVTDEAKLSLIAKSLAKAGDPIALYLGDSAAAVCAADGRVWVMPMAMDMLTPGMEAEQTLRALEPVLHTTPLIVHDAKALFHKAAALGLPLPRIDHDLMIAAYLLEPERKNADLETVLHGAPIEAKGRKDYTPVPPEKAAGDAYAMMRLRKEQRKRLEENGMQKLYTDMEMPLISVLFHMEQEGFTVDKAALQELGSQFLKEIAKLHDQAIKLVGGTEFNLNSPKQLSEVLFDQLKLPALGRKGKTGVYSTSADVLEQLDHPIIEPILRYRKLTKLQSVYIEGLSKLVDQTGRVHTTFDQTAAVTGRISSLEPNLQNIPVRSEEGREIRKAFIAKGDWLLLDADYSQIELRVLAHLSGDPAMKDAFVKGRISIPEPPPR